MGFAELTKKSLRASQLSHGDLVGLGGSPVFDCFLSLSMFASESIPNPVPSAPIDILSVASAYIFSSLNTQSKELAALGPAYSSRYYVSAIFLTMLIFLFVSFRIAFGCESLGTIIISVPIGLILGMLLVQQNTRLFGPESVNLVGIPLLQGRTATGKKIYVCPK